MKAVILAGGLGTRISEETSTRPKPMFVIGGKPILWHIMKTYSHHVINDFIICCGYKGYDIKEYFANYFLHMSDGTFDMSKNSMEVHQRKAEPWKVTLVVSQPSSEASTSLARCPCLLMWTASRRTLMPARSRPQLAPRQKPSCWRTRQATPSTSMSSRPCARNTSCGW